MIPILLVTHEGVGHALAHAAAEVLGHAPEALVVSEVPMDAATDQVEQQLVATLQQIDQGQGVLVLTDLFGATPTNCACRLTESRMRIVSGASLGMLLSCLTYQRDNLDELTEKATAAGVRAVVCCR